MVSKFVSNVHCIFAYLFQDSEGLERLAERGRKSLAGMGFRDFNHVKRKAQCLSLMLQMDCKGYKSLMIR